MEDDGLVLFYAGHRRKSSLLLPPVATMVVGVLLFLSPFAHPLAEEGVCVCVCFCVYALLF